MTNSTEGIAVIGMAVNVPGANNLEAFWENLKAGVESISFLSDEELTASGVEIKSIKDNPRYVRAAGILQNVEWFDAAFFGVNPREAELMDPQHRVLLECSWQALEDAGYDSESFRGSIGVYVGMNKASYLLSNLVPHGNTISPLAPNQTELANERDFLSTRISYKLNLKGPSINVQTACSTSLVAIVMGYQGLLNYQCDMALAGGVCVRVPHRQGYWYEETGVASPDGHCRPFDEYAQGTVGGSGAGVVVLKRLADAIADDDNIYAVIKGAAVNNDGAAKLSYTAPSVDGQAEVVAMAQAVAGVEPDTVSYVECHGTGTPLGDPIEIAGLTQAFRAGTDAKNFCAIGSVKSNFGHLDTAAGVAGFIKTSLSLQRKLLPPSLHYKSPNPKCHFETTPFYVNDRLTEWRAATTPRRAGVSSFGFGGTNAHAVLEEAPFTAPSSPSRSWQVLQLSAKTSTALEAATAELANWFEQHPESNLADAAYTLKIGRRGFDYRRIVVCQNLQDATAVLQTLDRARVHTRHQERRNTPVAFMFPGQGSQYVNMGRELYLNEPVFRRELERCAELLEPSLDCELLGVMYPEEGRTLEATERLTQTFLAQPAIFAIEYSLAKLWMEWGICPEMMIGHSVGEFVAACLAGVFSLKDALQLVASRGRLIQALPPGAMLAVPLSGKEVSQFLGKDLALAAVNGPLSCVVSGSREAVDALERQLVQSEKVPRHLHTSHAFHSAMMDPILETFEEEVRKVRLHPPAIRFVSCLTGTWITPDEATQPSYWVRHLRQTVRFSEGLDVLMQEPHRAMLEVGPGQTLSTFAKRHPTLGAEHTVLSTLRHAQEETSDVAFLLNSLGRLWLAGVKVDWLKFYGGERRQRIPLPTYPFERKRFWIDPPQNGNRLLIAPSEENLHREATLPEAQELLPGPSSECATPCPNVVPSVATSRRERILEELVSITHELSGIEPGALDVHTTFLELGFDSLFLTQANTEFRKKFDVKITFRQLLNEAPTLFALAEFIDRKLPPEAFPEQLGRPFMPELLVELIPKERHTETFSASGQAFAPGMTELTEAAAQARESVNVLERLIHEKLRAMSQLDSMGNGQSGAPRPPASNATHPISSVQGPGSDESLSRSSKTSNGLPDGRANEHQSGESKQQRFGPWKPIDSSPVEGLDSSKQKHLHNLITRYTARTSKSKELTQRYRPRLADPRVVAGFRTAWKEMVYPIVVARSSGSKIWDVDGNEYVDLTLGFGSNLFGHSPEFVTRALEEQIRKDMAIGPQSTLAGEVAQSICDLTGVERVSFCNTGSEAVLAALRVARTTTGRNKIALFSGAYHGIFDEVLVKSSPTGSKLRPIPIAPGIPQHMVRDVLVLEYGNPKSIEILEEHKEELAAVLVEPVQSRHPELQPREFLHLLREWTEGSGVVLIFDEMITGFRLHTGGAQAWFNVRADLVTYGKVIGGGMPIGVVGGKATLMDALDGGMWNYGDASFPEVGVTYFAGTFVRHPLALAASLSVLNHLRDSGPDLQQRLNERVTRFASDLNQGFQSTGARVHIQNCGSIFHLDFLDGHRLSSLLFYYLRERGVHIWEGRPLFISTAHSDEDLQFVVHAFEEAIGEMQEAEFLAPSRYSETRPTPQEAVDSSTQIPMIALSSAEVPSNGHSTTEEFTCINPAAQEFPLTESQMEIWLATRLGEDASRAFNESLTVRLKGKLDLKVMRQAVQQTVDRHEALRTTVSADGDYQRTVPSLAVEVPLTDLSTLDQENRRARLAILQSGELCQTFDLAKGPLLRLRIFRLDENEHLLQLVAHHIVCDGWSFGVLLHDLSVLYSAACQRTNSGLTEPMQFREYAASEQERQRTAGTAVEAYWVGLFSANIPVLELPTDHPRPAVKTYACRQQQTALDKAGLAELKRVSAQKGSTSFATLLATYLVLLHRLSGQEDIILGLGAAGQVSTGSANLVGHCVNFLPIRSQISADQPFSEYLATVQNLLLNAYDHRNYTFGSLIKKLNLPRDSGRLPLISVSITHETVTSELNFANLDVEVAGTPKGLCNFDLELYLMESAAGLAIDWRYNIDLFDDETIQRWLRHYETLVQSIAANPEERVADLPILTDAERQQLLFEWNDTRRDYPKDKCIHQLFEEQVERHPEAVAVACDDVQVTYQKLNQRANKVAHYLRNRGVGPEVLVGIGMNRSENMVVALLGILKAGGAYVPLDLTYPSERLKYIIQDTGITLVLTELDLLRGDLNSKNGTSFEAVCLDRDWCLIDTESDVNPRRLGTAETLAYVMYTSGSTGQPKGVGIPQRAVSRLVFGTNYARFGEDEVFLQMAPTSFDAATFELWGALLHGSRCVLYPGRLPNLKTLGQQIERHGVTTLWLTASLFNSVIDDAPDILRPIRQLLIGGETLSVTHVRQANEQLPNTQIINGYGPTENTTFTCYYTIPKMLDSSRPIPIGTPIANTQVHVLDRDLHPVAVGVVGELYTCGEGLARGYWGRADLTAERFVPHPFGQTGGERLYRTGDLARYRPDGSLEFVGRLDRQVKIRGFRIELGEIEAVVKQHPAVREAVVVLGQEGESEKRLVGYVVFRSDVGGKSHELQDYLRASLPEYMIPGSWVFLEQLPLTDNGKVNYEALLAGWKSSRRSAEAGYMAGRDETERKLIRIWEELLEVKPIGVKDNFFDLGGHSLLATRLIARIEKALGSVSLSSLFQSPTVEGLARELRLKKKAKEDSALVLFRNGGSRPPLFLHGGSFELSRYLGEDQPCYGIRPHGQDGRRSPATVEEMAADYLRQVRGVQPQGPYLIGGFSFGGLVAYEMAQQLRQSGQEVGLLVLIDPTPPNFSHSQTLRNNFPARHHSTLKRYLTVLRQADSTLLLGAVKSRSQRMANAVKMHLCRAYLRSGQRIPSRLRMFYFFEVSGQSARRYIPQLYPGPALLLSSDANSVDLWRHLVTGNLEIHQLQGHHLDAIKGPNVSLWAKPLRSRLSAAFQWHQAV